MFFKTSLSIIRVGSRSGVLGVRAFGILKVTSTIVMYSRRVPSTSVYDGGCNVEFKWYEVLFDLFKEIFLNIMIADAMNQSEQFHICSPR